ncbi:COBW domain-containing protein 1 [Blattella germanica]|nr:COBW domain-containing protein 1 [Blattella germanica]
MEGKPSLIEAVRQVALADLVIVNKVDLADSEQLAELKTEIRSINGAADLLEASHCKIQLDKILDLRAYSGTEQHNR